MSHSISEPLDERIHTYGYDIGNRQHLISLHGSAFRATTRIDQGQARALLFSEGGRLRVDSGGVIFVCRRWGKPKPDPANAVAEPRCRLVLYSRDRNFNTSSLSLSSASPLCSCAGILA